MVIIMGIYWAFGSPIATKWIGQKISAHTSITIENIEGSLKDGVQIHNLTHPYFSLQKGEISLNWSRLFRGKLHLYSLFLEGLHVKENIFQDKDSSNKPSGMQIPFDAFWIDSLHVSMYDFAYGSHTLFSLKARGENLFYAPKKPPRGKILLQAKSSLGELEAKGDLGDIMSASGSFVPLQIPKEISINSPILFEASGNTKRVQFNLQTPNIGYIPSNLPLFFDAPRLEGSYDFYQQSLKAHFDTTLLVAENQINLGGKMEMKENSLESLHFFLDANTTITQRGLTSLANNLKAPFLESLTLEKTLSLGLEGTLSGANYILEIPHLATHEATLSQTMLKGTITQNNLQGNFASTLTVANIPTALEGQFTMNEFDTNNLFYEIQSQSNLQEHLDSTLFGQVWGNLEGVEFVTALKPTLFNGTNISQLTLRGKANKEWVDFSMEGAFEHDQESLHVSIDNGNLNLENLPIKASFSPKIQFNNKPLIFIQEPQFSLHYAQNRLNANLVSKYLDLNATYEPQNKITTTLHVKPFEPSKFLSLSPSLRINKVEARGQLDYENVIQSDLKIYLNDLPFSLKANGSPQDLEVNLANKSFMMSASYQNAAFKSILDISNMEEFINTIQPFTTQEIPPILGSVNLEVSQKDEAIHFKAKSNSLAYQGQSLHDIAINGSYEEGLITLSRLNFGLDAGLGLESIQTFSLIKQGTYDTNSTDLQLDFKGLSIKASAKPHLSINAEAHEFFLSHPLYGEGIVSGALHVNQEDKNVTIGGELSAKQVKAHYKPSGFSIHSDRDILIVDTNSSNKEEDFFTQNIGLDLALIVDDIHYKQGEIDLKTSGIFYLKKEPTKALEFYGSILDITGNIVTLGKKFDISTSNLYFRGYNPIDPVLDILALYKHQETDITIRITGTQSNPRVYLSSNPLMSQRAIFPIFVF